jgi:hypothetical protein
MASDALSRSCGRCSAPARRSTAISTLGFIANSFGTSQRALPVFCQDLVKVLSSMAAANGRFELAVLFQRLQPLRVRYVHAANLVFQR